jgi:phosphoserine phosphatase RsbU/P
MNTHLNILLLEDSDADADLLVRHLKREKIDFGYTRVSDKTGFCNAIQENAYDLVIADHSLHQFNGMEAFRLLKEKNSAVPFILVTGTLSEKDLGAYTRAGVDDYLLKENLLRLTVSIENVIHKKHIQKLHEKLELAHQSITDSINYSRLIQDAMLPLGSVLTTDFPGAFIFYQPKDVLSGDFYWFEKKEDLFFVAVADCTGHGIPGALLSMVGHNLLNEAINARNLALPSEVLSLLSERTAEMLKSDTSALRDGMDIALCSIDGKKKVLTYSGANRPLFIARKGEWIVLKPEKTAIGEMANKSVPYTNQVIPLQSGDRLFLFSDGFADQFNHRSDKKLLMKGFLNLLLSASFLSLPAQERTITSFFEQWKGSKEQTDDVLLIGIEIA